LRRVSVSDGDAHIRESIVELMKKHGLPDERINHSLRVADLSLQISDLMTHDGIELDRRVIEKGALLHDVGYLHCKGELVEIPEWRVYGIKIPSDDINHPTIGGAIVGMWGFSEEVSNCVLRHNIGGFTVEECVLLNVDPVPEKDCAPMTYEEKIVHYADHLMLLDRLKLDALKDTQASAKACLPWLNYYFIRRANKRIEIDDPIPQREVALNNELKKYLKALERLP
jgi:putative nucleotidyltransferase with HDIG domain